MKKLLVLLLTLMTSLPLAGMNTHCAQQPSTSSNETMVTIKFWDIASKDFVHTADQGNNPIAITRTIPKKYADLSRTFRDQQEEIQPDIGMVYYNDLATFDILVTYLPLLYNISTTTNLTDEQKKLAHELLLKKIVILTPEQLGAMANLANYLELNPLIEAALIAIKKQLFEYLPRGPHQFGNKSYMLNRDQPNLKKQFFQSVHPEQFDPYQLHPQLLKKLLPTLVDEALKYIATRGITDPYSQNLVPESMKNSIKFLEENITLPQALLLAYAHKKALSDSNRDGININLYPQLQLTALYDSFDQGELQGKEIKDLIKPLVYQNELTDKERAMPPTILLKDWHPKISNWWDF